jgi:hypothetical protein
MNEESIDIGLTVTDEREDVTLNRASAKEGELFDVGEYIIPPNIARPVFYVSNLMLVQVSGSGSELCTRAIPIMCCVY